MIFAFQTNLKNCCQSYTFEHRVTTVGDQWDKHVGCVSNLALFYMPILNQFNILAISIFFKSVDISTIDMSYRYIEQGYLSPIKERKLEIEKVFSVMLSYTLLAWCMGVGGEDVCPHLHTITPYYLISFYLAILSPHGGYNLYIKDNQIYLLQTIISLFLGANEFYIRRPAFPLNSYQKYIS